MAEPHLIHYIQMKSNGQKPLLPPTSSIIPLETNSTTQEKIYYPQGNYV